jgi:pimeloyl-ACP methyl ester carboxylesterase
MALERAGRRLRDATGPSSIAAATGLALAGAAAIVQVRTRSAEAAHPPLGQFVSLRDGRLHYLSAGTGRPVVFLHGNGLMAEDFRASSLLQLIGGFAHAVAFDRPGFGYSERSWMHTWNAAAQASLIRDACRALGLEKPVIVAHSWASMVALEMALQAPQDLGGLVLVSGYYFPSVRADVALFSPPALPLLGDLLRYTLAPFAAEAMKPKLIAKIFAPQAVPDAFMERFPHALLSRPGQIRAAAEDAAHMIGSAHALASRYPEVSLPVTILAGDADAVVEPSQADELARALPRGKLDRVRGAGHMLHYALPERVMEAVRGLMA